MSRICDILQTLGNLTKRGFYLAINIVLGDTKMKVGRLNVITGIISSVLVLQCWFAGQAVGAQTPASQPAAEPNGPSPKIVFEQVIHDFGPVAPALLVPASSSSKMKAPVSSKLVRSPKPAAAPSLRLKRRNMLPVRKERLMSDTTPTGPAAPKFDTSMCSQTIRITRESS